ncbi:hypothetical protein AB0C10_09280 [Microbispora amethystogenes]|uniref:hypothetical protein n=1 Tax=Microbispora amethystogenes TaxID=1427754 RepID=UPI0033DCE86A
MVSALFASAVVAQFAGKALTDLLVWRPVFLLGGGAFAVMTVAGPEGTPMPPCRSCCATRAWC